MNTRFETHRALKVDASDVDRRQTAEILRTQCAERRLDGAELQERLTAVDQAATVSDLIRLIADLPGKALAQAEVDSRRAPLLKLRPLLTLRPILIAFAGVWDQLRRGRTAMKVIVDLDACAAHGDCVGAAPRSGSKAERSYLLASNSLSHAGHRFPGCASILGV